MPATPSEFDSALKRLLKASWLINSLDKDASSADHDTLKLQKHAVPMGKIIRSQTPCTSELKKKWILKKKFVKLENTIEVALPMGKTGDIFFFQSNSIRCHEDLTVHMSYHSPIWAVDLVRIPNGSGKRLKPPVAAGWQDHTALVLGKRYQVRFCKLPLWR